VGLVADRRLSRKRLALRHFQHLGRTELVPQTHNGQPAHVPGGHQFSLRRETDGRISAAGRPVGALPARPDFYDRLADETVRRHRISHFQNAGQSHHWLYPWRVSPALVAEPKPEKLLCASV